NVTPHAFAPEIFPSHWRDQSPYCVSPVRYAYSFAITESPAPCETVSNEFHGQPNPNGSLFVWLIEVVIWPAMSLSKSLCVTAKLLGFPASVIARYNSKCARPLTS